MRGLAANRDFRRLWIGQVASDLGSSMSGLVVPMLALALTGSTWLAGLTGTVGFAAIWLAQLPGGYIADMFDRRRVMLLCDGLRLLLFLGLAIGVALGVVSIWLLLAVHALTSFLWIVFVSAEAQAIRQIVDRDQIPEAVSAAEARGYAVELVGPVVGGWLFGLSRALPLFGDALSFAVSWLCIRRIRTPLAPESKPQLRRLLPDVGEGWTTLWRTAFLRSKVVYSTLTNIAVSALLFLLILDRDASAAGIGATVSLAAGAGLTGSLLAPLVQRRVPLRLLLCGVAVIRGALLLLAALTGSGVLFALVIASVIFLGPLVNATLSAATVLVVPGEVLGRASGASRFLSSALQPLAPLATGLLLEMLPRSGGQLVVAGAFGVVALAALGLPGLRVPLRAASRASAEPGASAAAETDERTSGEPVTPAR